MATAAVVLAVVLLALVGVLLLQVRVLRRRALDLEATLAMLLPMAPLSPDVEATFGAGRRRLIVIEILNPLELAASRGRVASLAAGLAPRAIRKIVNDQAMQAIQLQLADEGVRADVRIHAAG